MFQVIQTFPPSQSLPLKSSRFPKTKDWLLMREGSEVLLEIKNYFRALSDHHCFSTKQISQSIWRCKCGLWTSQNGNIAISCLFFVWRYSYLERVVVESWWITLCGILYSSGTADTNFLPESSCVCTTSHLKPRISLLNLYNYITFYC